MRLRVVPFVCAFAAVSGAFATTVSLGVSPNPVTYGRPVTLTATVSPAPSGGSVAFYDGVAVVGLAPVLNGTAQLFTQQLQSGPRKLIARYNGTASPVVPVAVNPLPGGGFSPSRTFPVGPPVAPNQPQLERTPASVAVADFNHDGKLDAVLPVYSAQTGAVTQVAVMRGNGDGSFQAPTYFTAGTSLVAIAVGDFNGDGNADLALADLGNSQSTPAIPASVNILLGVGDGTFRAPAVYTISGVPYTLITGDFNLDGKEDVAVSNQSGSNDVFVFLGNGNGTLAAARSFSTGTQTGAYGLALGDFNGDGIPDIGVAEDGIVILVGTGGGNFSVGSVNVAGTFPNDVQMGDFNGDGKADLVCASGTDNTVSVFLGNGNGTFQSQAVYPVDDSPESITIADFNGDGKQDIAVANSYIFSGAGLPGTVSLLLGNGNGTFQGATNYQTGPTPLTVVQGDFTGGGTVDLATADFGDGTDVIPGDLGILTSTGCVTISALGPTNYDSNGGTLIVNVMASCAWTASSSASWLLLSANSGTGYGQIAVVIQPNTSGADRTGTVSIGGQTLTFVQDFTQTTFTDVAPGVYYFDAVNLLKAHTVTSGCTSTQYCPTSSVTRDQMAIFIVRTVFGSDNFPPPSQVPYFTDVTPTTYGFQWIQKLYELGITAGCAPNLYCPTAQVTRDQMAVFIIRARYGATTAFTYPPGPIFTDVPGTEFAYQWIQRMAEDNITTGCAPSLYCPGNPVTRGDMAIFLMRGGFNQLLPPTEPIISAISPATLAPGTSGTFTITGVNTNFTSGLTYIVPVGGISAGTPAVASATQLSVTLTAPAVPLAQPVSVYVKTGASEAVLPNGLRIQ